MCAEGLQDIQVHACILNVVASSPHVVVNRVLLRRAMSRALSLHLNRRLADGGMSLGQLSQLLFGQ
jgi:hypothetical protein